MTEDEISKLCASLKSLGERMSHIVHLSLYNKFVAEAGLSETQIRETFNVPKFSNHRPGIYAGSPSTLRFGKTLELERMSRTTGRPLTLYPHQQKVMDGLRSIIDRQKNVMFVDFESRFLTKFPHDFNFSFDETGYPLRKTRSTRTKEPNAHQKMGKRMRNKVQVPTKEMQIVNGNKHTKKKRKRK